MEKPVVVSIRIRPRLESENAESHSNERYAKTACVAAGDSSVRLWNGKASQECAFHHFHFDNVFAPDDTQEDVYEASTVSAVDAALSGLNATVLAYGQTGSGKTHTILGSLAPSSISSPSASLPAESGILLRAVEDLLQFQKRARAQRNVSLLIGVSAVEVYLDEVRDLLSEGSEPSIIQLMLVKDTVRLPKLTYWRIDNLKDIGEVYQRAMLKRVQRATAANDTSSRSHAIFTIDLYQQPITEQGPYFSLQECIRYRKEALVTSLDPHKSAKVPIARSSLFRDAANPLLGTSERPIMYSKIVFVDLAGSEKAKKSGVVGEGMNELRSINASLTALGNVVRSVHEQYRHIPYRDSKLTMVLRDAFASPGARISLIATVNPTALTIDESLSTLYFANRVKDLKALPASGGGTGGAGAALSAEEGYLRSLKVFDALKADLRICEHENECRLTFLPRANALFCNKNPLFDPLTMTAVPDSEDKAITLKALCYALKAEAQRRSASRDIVEVTDEEFEDMINAYVEAAAAKRASISEELQRNASAAALFEKEKADQIAVLTAEKQQQEAKRAERKNLTARRDKLTAQMAELETHFSAVERDFACFRGSENEEDLRSMGVEKQKEIQEAAEWAHGSDALQKALELAECYHALWELYVGNRALKREKRELHSVISSREQSTASSGGAADPPPPECLTGILALGALPVNTMQMPSPSPQRSSEDGERKSRSPYDARRYFTELYSRAKLGVAAFRINKSGEAVRRVFYLKQKPAAEGGKSMRLCWDDASRATRVSGSHHVDLDTVEAIILGQSTPNFEKFKRNNNNAEDFSRSFSLIQRSEGERDPTAKKVLDVVCESVADLELWVATLSRFTGVWPRFDIVAEPGSALASPTATDASITAAAEDGVTSEEALYCQGWCIPLDVYLECRRQIRRQCTKRQRIALALSPGELAVLSGLDIFRASAMWLLYRRLGMVTNPSSSLNCFVDPGEPQITAAKN